MDIEEVKTIIRKATMYESVICGGALCGLTTIYTFVHLANVYIRKIEVMSPEEWEKYCKKSGREIVIV